MSAITIRFPEELMSEVETRSHNLHISRGEYIRKAVEQMNSLLSEKERKEKLMNASLKVRKESMIVNAEFDGVEYDPQA